MSAALWYEAYVEESDDTSLIVLKGHLIIEEYLLVLATYVFTNPQHLVGANLMFHKLACVIRAAVPTQSDDPHWNLILSLNSLRNSLAHRAHPSKRQTRLKELFAIHEEIRSTGDIANDGRKSDAERLKNVVIDCMNFLLRQIGNFQQSEHRQ